MRINIVAPPLNMSGGIRVTAIYAKELRELGHEVDVIVGHFGAVPLWKALLNRLRGRAWVAAKGQPANHLDTMGVAYRELSLREPMDDRCFPPADVTIATFWTTAETVAALPASRGKKVYMIQGYEAFAPHPVERVRQTYRLPLKKVVVASWLQKLMKDDFGDADAALVPNAVEMENFFLGPRKRTAVRRVGFVYSSLKIKGPDLAFEALRLVQARLPDVEVVMFGTDRKPEAFSSLTRAVYLQRPEPRKIAEIYASCDVWLFTSRMEGFGLPILEAMAAGTPVVATAAAAAPDLLAQGGGVLVGAFDPAAIAEATLSVLTGDDARWQELSAEALAVASGYTWKDAARKLEAVLLDEVEGR